VASDEIKAQIIDVARSQYPEEACGLITVKGDKLSMRPCQNTHGDKKHMGCTFFLSRTPIFCLRGGVLLCMAF